MADKDAEEVVQIDKEKLKELLKGLSGAEIDEFFELMDEIKEKNPKADILALIEIYKDPAKREILKVNKLLGESAEEAPAELTEAEVKLKITPSAEETVRVGKANDVINQLRSKIREHDPELADKLEEDLKPLDPNQIENFSKLMMVEGMLAGASERSPDVEAMAKELTANIGRIRSFVLEELAWLAAEMAAGAVLTFLTAGAAAPATAAHPLSNQSPSDFLEKNRPNL